MKTFATYFLLLIFPLTPYGLPVKLKVVSAEKSGGEIYVSIFNSEPTYKAREVYRSFILNADDEIVTREINLIKGQYVFTIFDGIP